MLTLTLTQCLLQFVWSLRSLCPLRLAKSWSGSSGPLRWQDPGLVASLFTSAALAKSLLWVFRFGPHGISLAEVAIYGWGMGEGVYNLTLYSIHNISN